MNFGLQNTLMSMIAESSRRHPGLVATISAMSAPPTAIHVLPQAPTATAPVATSNELPQAPQQQSARANPLVEQREHTTTAESAHRPADKPTGPKKKIIYPPCGTSTSLFGKSIASRSKLTQPEVKPVVQRAKRVEPEAKRVEQAVEPPAAPKVKQTEVVEQTQEESKESPPDEPADVPNVDRVEKALESLRSSAEFNSTFGKTEGRGLLYVKDGQVKHFRTKADFNAQFKCRLTVPFPQVGSSADWRGAKLYATKSSFTL